MIYAYRQGIMELPFQQELKRMQSALAAHEIDMQPQFTVCDTRHS